MSEHRKPISSLTISFATNKGKKTTRIDIFPAYLFAGKWSPYTNKFHPKLPLHSKKRSEKWKSLYRVRINGQWFSTRAKYTLLTKQQILGKWVDTIF
jgi:hypothetical protein